MSFVDIHAHTECQYLAGWSPMVPWATAIPPAIPINSAIKTTIGTVIAAPIILGVK